VAECRTCRYVDKPFIEHYVYHRYSEVRVLIVSESPPPGAKKDFLYNLGHSDRLRKTLSKFFGIDEGKLLETLFRKGVLWDMAARCRPPSKRDVYAMARRCSYVTKLVVEEYKPFRIVALGRVAGEQLRSVLKSCSYVPREVVYDHHPLYVVRFRRDCAAEYFNRLRSLIDV